MRRVSGGGDFTTPTKKKREETQPDTPKKEPFYITLRRRYLEELRNSGDAVKGIGIQPSEPAYANFDEADFDSNEAGESPGYKHGLYDGKHGHEAIDFHYVPMTETVNDIFIDQTYRGDYRKGYDVGRGNK